MPGDMQMVEWCRAAELSLHALLTKADKLKRIEATRSLQQTRSGLDAVGLKVSAQLFSAPRRDGLAALRSRLLDWLDLDPRASCG